MNPFALLSALVNGLLAYLQWRAAEAQSNIISARYRLTRQIETDVEADENEITRLRSLGDPASQLLADKLRARIARANGIVATLPTPGASPNGGTNGAN